MNFDTACKFSFEKINYTYEYASEDRDAIKDSIYLFHDGILHDKHRPVMSELSVTLCSDKMEPLSKEMNKHGLNIDMTETKIPDITKSDHLRYYK